MATAAKKPARRTTKATAKPAAAENASTEAAEIVGEFSDAARDQMDSVFAAFTDNADMMREQAEETMATMRENFETATTRLQSVNAEIMTAARDEITDAVDFANELARAKSLTDAMEIQRDYWTNLFETRVERAREFTQTSTEAARDVLDPMTETFSTAMKNNPFEKFFPFATK